MSYCLACRDLSLSSLCSSQLHILTAREAFSRTSTPPWNERRPMMSSSRLKQRDEASGGASSSFSACVLAGTDPAAGVPTPSLNTRHSAIQISIDQSLHCCLSSNGPNTSNSSRVPPLLSKKRRINTNKIVNSYQTDRLNHCHLLNLFIRIANEHLDDEKYFSEEILIL